MTQTPAQIRKVLKDGELLLNKEPVEMDIKDTCNHVNGWRVYKQRKGIQFYKCHFCGEISD